MDKFAPVSAWLKARAENVIALLLLSMFVTFLLQILFRRVLGWSVGWTVEWAQERKLFGSTLADQQWVQFKLAEMKTEVESLRALTYRACELYVQGQDVTELASMAKLKAGRLNRTIPDGCLQFWGGMGYTLENKVSRMYRDGRLGSIGGGADEVMLQILSRQSGSRR